MKLGEIKIEALKLMFASDGLSPKIADLPELESDENFKFYLAAMNGSINRCLSIFEQAQIIPAKFLLIDSNLGSYEKGVISFDFDDLEVDALKVLSVKKRDGIGLSETELDFQFRNNILMVESNSGGEFVVELLPKLARISDDTSDTEEIDLPERFVDMMVHFIKGELYAEDEPALASVSMERFESFIRGFRGSSDCGGKVKNIYCQTEM